MASVADWTEQQKADVALLFTNLAGLFSALSKAANAVNPLGLQAFAAARVTPLIQAIMTENLHAADLIPNPTGYAGKQDVTVAEFNQMQTVANALMATLQTALAGAAPDGWLPKAVGINT